MSNKRAEFSINDDIDLELLINNKKNNSFIDRRDIEKTAEASGFTKRLPKKLKIRRRKSPYVEQLGVKIRPLMKEIFQEIGEKLSIYDHTTFERAMLALLEKENDQELIKKYQEAVCTKRT